MNLRLLAARLFFSSQNVFAPCAARPRGRCSGAALIFALGMAWTPSAVSQGTTPLEFSVSPTPVGSGARAAGMADAFLSIADDATAASWNPAGLVQLQRPEISVVGAYNRISEDFHSDTVMGLDSNQDSDNLELNFLSVVYPLPFSIGTSNIALSLSYQRKYDFTRNADLNLNFVQDVAGNTVITDRVVDFEQEGGFATITPSLAFEITEALSVGVSANIWRSSFLSDNRWEQSVSQVSMSTVNGNPLPTATRFEEETYDDFEAENFGIGVLWKATQKLSLGFRYDTAFEGNVDYDRQVITNGMPGTPMSERRKIHFPDTISVGASYRFNDKLTVALDLVRTDWDDLYVEAADGSKTSLVDGFDIDDPAVATNFDPTTTVRLGAEYVLIPETTGAQLNTLWTLRGGLFFDQEPASGRSRGADPINPPPGDGKPDNFYGFTVGIGLLAYQRVNLDVAYQFRYGHDVNADFITGARDFDEDVFQHRVLLSTVIYF